jgi:N-methylhydantoinase B
MRPYGTDHVEGQMLGIREWLPLDGAAGGFQGAMTVYEIHGVDGTIDRVSNADVLANLLTVDQARSVYGVVMLAGATVDVAATLTRREEIVADRLALATPPVRSLDLSDLPPPAQSEELPLYPGVVHRGRVAHAAASGAPLAMAPDVSPLRGTELGGSAP